MDAKLCVILLIFNAFHMCESKYGYVLWNDNNVTVKLTDYFADIPDVHVARATYSNEINTTGWAFLEIHTSEDCSDENQAYAAGYLEGYLTRDLVWMHWQNMLKGYCYNKTDVCGLIEEFVDQNEQYVTSMVDMYGYDAYWHQIKLYFIQIEGLAVGYNAATKDPYQWLTTRDIIWINMLGDLDELAFALSMPKTSPDGMLFGDHCTGLVKLLPDLTNLYTAQATWNSYQSMLRFQKMYVMNLRMSPANKERIPGYKMSLTSYPAFVQSTDDFYIISTGLVAGETTIGNSNRTLFELVKPVGQILEYARAMVANRMARTGREWVEIFRKHNSGTYNNQWFIVDYKKFKPRRGRYPGLVKPGLLWVVEQLPGYTESADLTEQLKHTSYFPSYNIPYFPRVFNLSGGNVRIATYGDWFGYRTNPRAKIILEKQANIYNLRDMYNTMRYNDFKHDPLARCEQCKPPYSACNAIAARNDLNLANGTYPFRALGHRSHGATDAKITSAYLWRSYRFLAISSPTHNISRGIPPFAYQSMLRFQKMYVMNLRMSPANKERIPGYKMSLTSYPAFVQSTDDFYIISTGLVAGETTIGNSNRTLFELVKPVGQILEYARAMVANRMARTGREWVEIFRKHNSGTYNNQWFIVDYKKFKPRRGRYPGLVKPGLLWVVEQLPGYTESADLTEQLKHTSYFPSYNIPYFPRVFNLSGGNVRIATYGDWFGYRTNPRAKIILEKQANIYNLRDMYNTMRYNDFKHDPLARCEQCKPPYSACNAIAARNDLNLANGTYPFRALGHRSHGATDAKITSAYLWRSYRFLAISSPTHNISRGIPPFAWSKFDMGAHVSHVGHPDEWMFAPMLHDWEWE